MNQLLNFHENSSLYERIYSNPYMMTRYLLAGGRPFIVVDDYIAHDHLYYDYNVKGVNRSKQFFENLNKPVIPAHIRAQLPCKHCPEHSANDDLELFLPRRFKLQAAANNNESDEKIDDFTDKLINQLYHSALAGCADDCPVKIAWLSMELTKAAK